VEEEALIKPIDTLEGLASDEHKCTGNSLNLYRRNRYRRSGLVEVERSADHGQPVQPQAPRNCVGERRLSPPSTLLLSAIRIEEQPGSRRQPGVRLHGMDQRRHRERLNDAVWIDDE
jgi:hypothetical protein